MNFSKRVESEKKETKLGKYIIKFHTVDVNKIAEHNSISSIAGIFKLMAKLVIEEDPAATRWLLSIIGANLCYKKTAEWLLSHKDEWDNLNLVVLALSPNLAVHILVTNLENSTIIYDLDNAKETVLDGYFLPLSDLKKVPSIQQFRELNNSKYF